MKEPVLVVMAAGMGSRYGGLKQIDPVDQEGHIIMDFSIYDAVRAGFKKAWTEKDYNKIVNVGDRLPETVIQEDDKLLMYYDNAQIRIDM